MLQGYKYFTTNELEPSGWLLDQLKLQRDGLNGNLDKVWPDVRDSKWIGGECEGWERVPYWLDGFIPLAYLLDDEDMKARAKHYVDKMLEFQQDDGWICPNGDTPREEYDTWAIILIAKVFTVYYDCSRDERIPTAVYRILKNYYELLSEGKIKLFEWGKFRWFETFISIKWLMENVGREEWMTELARIVREQGADYESFSELWETPLNVWRQETHVVNVAMMLKYEALVCDVLGEETTGLAERLYQKLKKYNGTAVGTLTGDECLSGLSPIQGTELCSVVELMYSFEWLYALTGDVEWAERLEMAAFNALPATISDDMWTHQYDQLVNQIACVRFDGKPIFRTNGASAHIFGLEPHFGCCTANFGQGWPKLALSAFAYNEKEVVSAVPLPSNLSFEWKGTPVEIRLETQYPFVNRLVYRVRAEKAVDMKLKLRIPSFAEELRVNGEAKRRTKYLTFSGFSGGETVITVDFETVPTLKSRSQGLYNVQCGSLVFAANIKPRYEMKEYVKNGVERKFPYCDYNVYPESEWNFAFASRELKLVRGEIGDIPFSSENPPLKVEAELCHIAWGYADGYNTVCARVPSSRTPIDEPFKLELYPYGCAKLRMTELPLVKKQK